MDDYKEAHEIAGLRELLGFNKQPLIPQYFGSFDQRLLASTLDWFFVAGGCIILAFIVIFIAHVTDWFGDNTAIRIAIPFSLLCDYPVS